jgi:two-component system OmpR family response regulator
MHRLLLIDDDERLGPLLARYFQRFDLSLESATDPLRGLERLAEDRSFELVILDLMLPQIDGFEVCRRIRRDSQVPILMLTARGEVMDRVIGLELGADDYLPKPFEPRELVDRIQNILKRSAAPAGAETILRFDDLVIDRGRQTVTRGGTPLALTAAEYQLLVLLAGAPGRPFSRDEILNRLRGIDAEVFSRAVDILVSRLRRKLRPGEYIRTIRGTGYAFVGGSP